MEPGHEDREYLDLRERPVQERVASMEPGHEDREYRGPAQGWPPEERSLNGARS